MHKNNFKKLKENKKLKKLFSKSFNQLTLL